MAQTAETRWCRIMVALCNCCGAIAHRYPLELFQVCAKCGRGICLPRAVVYEGRRSHAA